MNPQRPDPDALLAHLQQAEQRASRGRLKIFFGASAGVGKTCAMLQAGHQQLLQGRDVLVGLLETHGRSDTETAAAGLPRLPLRTVERHGRALPEFDLDGALARRPELLLVDEYAHSNPPGSRHPKRWQDIEELLDAGINVYTTVNVQHLESLNEVVAGITGIRVRETIPDSAFDAADDVLLVDLPPEELRQRLRAGKVYLPGQAERAAGQFFRKGNLLALRELALRHVANRVDGEVQRYRRDKSIANVWHTRDALLVCIGPGTNEASVVRAGLRLAEQLGVPWHAIYIETPRLQRLPAARRTAILKVLELAAQLGASTATVADPVVDAAIVRYARQHNLGRVLLGPAGGRRLWWRANLAERVARRGDELEVTQAAAGRNAPPARAEAITTPGLPWLERWRAPATAWRDAVLVVVATTAIAAALYPTFDLANIVMLFLLAVVIVAMRGGQGPATLAAFLGVGAFDFYFVPPRFSFAVSDAQYLLTFAVMLCVGLVTGQLMASLRFQLRVASLREGRVRALYEMAEALSGALLPAQISATCAQFAERSLGMRCALLPLRDDGTLDVPLDMAGAPPELDMALARWAFDHGSNAGRGTDTLPGSPVLYVPLRAPMRVRGILALQPMVADRLMPPEQWRLLDTFARLIAIALERIHFVAVAQQSDLQVASERLRNSLLAAVSHDLRTPLTALAGLADSLASTQPALPDTQQAMALALRDQAFRVNALVDKLLDMARLEQAQGPLRTDWQSLEELLGSALRRNEQVLAGRAVSLQLAADLPLLELDAVMAELVFNNLLENITKYTPAGSPLEIHAWTTAETVEVRFIDHGPGIAPDQRERVFEKFVRGTHESSVSGVGLGLAICRAVLDAHQGRIWVEPGPDGGACFAVRLPRHESPEVPIESIPEDLLTGDTQPSESSPGPHGIGGSAVSGNTV